MKKRQREDGESGDISTLMDKNCVDLLLCLATHTHTYPAEVATKLKQVPVETTVGVINH